MNRTGAAWRLVERHYQESGLDECKSLADFDWRFNPKVQRTASPPLEQAPFKFGVEAQNAVINGRTGTGKSYSAKAIAYQGALERHTVCNLDADGAFPAFSLSGDAEQRQQQRPLVDVDMFVFDELFLVRLIADKADELLKTQAHQRYKLKRSILVTSNRVEQDWEKYRGINTLTTIILDQKMRRAHILEFEMIVTGSMRPSHASRAWRIPS